MDGKDELSHRLQSTDEITHDFLKEICSDSNECIVFGIEVDKIKEYFEYFTNFNLVKEFEILSGGTQGIIQLIKYEKNNYMTYAILKSSTLDKSDNPYYEFLVGKFLNTQLQFFPCFVQTYGLFEYTSQSAFQYLTNCSNDCELSEVKTGLVSVPDFSIDENLIKSCKNPTHFSILMEYLKDTVSIKTFLLTQKYPLKYDEENDEWYSDDRDWKYATVAKCDLYINEIPYILFQIYMPLYFLSDVFAHYDLHWSNILLYEPSKGKSIKYFYYLQNGEVIIFYSPYIVKIIDYGRSYFSDGQINSKMIYEKICEIGECNPECGKTKGYVELSTIKKNTSIDLKLFDYLQTNLHSGSVKKITQIINETIQKKKDALTDVADIELLDIKLENLNKYFEFQNKVIDMNKHFRTVAFNEITDEYNGININNILDLFSELKKLILLESFQLNNTKTYGLDVDKIYGELHIYSDRQTPSRFVKR